MEKLPKSPRNFRSLQDFGSLAPNRGCENFGTGSVNPAHSLRNRKLQIELCSALCVLSVASGVAPSLNCALPLLLCPLFWAFCLGCLVVEPLEWPRDVAQWFRKIARLPGAIFLDSAKPDALLGRYSYLSADPFQTIRSRGARTLWIRSGEKARRFSGVCPFELLAKELSTFRVEHVADLPAFQGGAAGVFSFDLCHRIERLPRPRFNEFRLAHMAVGFYDWVVALDHQKRQTWIISTGFPEAELSCRQRRAEARAAMVQTWLSADPDDSAPSVALRDQRERPVSLDRLAPQWPVDGLPNVTSNFTRDAYLRAVQRAIAYIRAGDIYQVNLSQRLLYRLTESPAELYLRLRERNRAPFAGYLDGGPFVIASASPERFLWLRDGEIETRPIKGTRPRWPMPQADMYSKGELRESEKDRAENVMIVDLLRNDLGRVCRYGSIRVADPLRLESYEFVHHLVSEVRGRLRPEFGPVDLLRSAFPGGSVTGAPKVRAMEIIAELEPTARGPYCGSLGFIAFNRAMDTNILIRTFTASRGWLQFPVGGGIVAESTPEREYEETLHKAEGMIRALE